MNNKYLQLKALKRIIDEKVPFQFALEKTIAQNNLSEEEKLAFKMDVLGSLRHFNYLQYEATTAFPEFEKDDDEIYLIILALYGIRYRSKDIATYLVIDQTLETIDYMELRLDKEQTKEKLQALSLEKTPLPTELMKDPYAYNAMFFNTPLWIVKLWAKEYGDEQTMNLMLANQRRGTQYLAINTLTKSPADYEDDERLTLSPIVKTALEYRVGPCSELDDVKNGDLFAQDLSNQIMLEEIPFDYNQRILHIGSISGGLAAGLALRSYPLHGFVEALFPDEGKLRRGKAMIARLGLTNIRARFGDVNLMKTYSPYEEFDLVMLSPKSSQLGQIRRRPDILVTLQEPSVAYYGRQQLAKLKEAAKFLVPGGLLVYAVSTITEDETTNVINKFLKDQSFTKVYSRQIFPNEYGSDGLFFAILKRQ